MVGATLSVSAPNNRAITGPKAATPTYSEVTDKLGAITQSKEMSLLVGRGLLVTGQGPLGDRAGGLLPLLMDSHDQRGTGFHLGTRNRTRSLWTDGPKAERGGGG